MSLGTFILGAWLPALAAKPALERGFVEKASLFCQPRAQFLLDFALGLTAATLAGASNVLALKFPLFSGVKLWIGMASAAFFLAMDSAITRQRAIIDRTCSKGSRTLPERVRPMARKFASVALGSALIVAMLLTVILLNGVDWLAVHAYDPSALAEAKSSVMWEMLFVTLALTAALGVLIVRYSENLRRLLNAQTQVLESVSQGDFTRFTPVATADEFGVIAARTNSMIDGLRHRTQLMEALEQARAVQRSLLPGVIPLRQGIDIAAAAIYSEQTGGDYYDFLELAGETLAVVVADVSGHGVDSALLMASARGFLRQAALCLSDISRIVTTLNRHLARDVAGSGHFITLFMLVVDPVGKRIEWIRAGHDPALAYHPGTDTFEELSGRGMALAINPEATYLPQRLRQWPAGAILFLGTDGLWESFGPDKSMYGKARLHQVIRENARKPAREIMEAITDDWRAFLDGAPQQDDVTMVVIRFE